MNVKHCESCRYTNNTMVKDPVISKYINLKIIMLIFHIITTKPDVFPGILSTSLIGRAKGTIWDIKIYNLSKNERHRHCEECVATPWQSHLNLLSHYN